MLLTANHFGKTFWLPMPPTEKRWLLTKSSQDKAAAAKEYIPLDGQIAVMSELWCLTSRHKHTDSSFSAYARQSLRSPSRGIPRQQGRSIAARYGYSLFIFFYEIFAQNQ